LKEIGERMIFRISELESPIEMDDAKPSLLVGISKDFTYFFLASILSFKKLINNKF
jgi:hypothetical protein